MMPTVSPPRRAKPLMASGVLWDHFKDVSVDSRMATPAIGRHMQSITGADAVGGFHRRMAGQDRAIKGSSIQCSA